MNMHRYWKIYCLIWSMIIISWLIVLYAITLPRYTGYAKAVLIECHEDIKDYSGVKTFAYISKAVFTAGNKQIQFTTSSRFPCDSPGHVWTVNYNVLKPSEFDIYDSYHFFHSAGFFMLVNTIVVFGIISFLFVYYQIKNLKLKFP